MKKYLIIAAIAFISCSKESLKQRPVTEVEPEIVSCTWVEIRDGGGFRPRFTVVIKSDTNTVAKVELIAEYASVRWEVYKPGNGTYIMYDHIADFPTYVDYAYYHFQFIKKDGSKLRLPDFQVY